MTVTINGTTGIAAPLGSAGSPSNVNTSDATTGLYFPASNTVGISTAGTNALYIDASQNVGIGSTSPGQKLSLGSGSSNVALQAAFNTATGAAVVGLQSDNSFIINQQIGQPIIVKTSNTEQMRIDASGNVGIGTTSPQRKVDIEQSGTDYQLRIGDTGGNYYDIGRNTSNGLLTFYGSQAAASGYVFSTVNGERMRIDTSGNLLLGTNGFSGKLTVVAGNSICYYGYNTSTSDFFPVYANQGGSSSSSLYVMPMRFGGSTLNGSIYWNGSVVLYQGSSDYRLKENVQPMSGALNRISELKPCTYVWKEQQIAGEGFLAHELQAIIPAAVTGEKDAVNEDGSIHPQQIDLSRIVPHLVAALQELSAEVTALKAKVGA
jgi:Chaperone of endosialidase